MTSEISLFVNPTAGRGRGARTVRPAAAALRAVGFRVRTVLGSDGFDALRKAGEAVDGGTGALVAVGGDGLVSLALQAVAGTQVPLGVIAVGTGNDFARTLGLPVNDPVTAALLAADTLKNGAPSAVDLGRVTGGRAVTWFGTVLASGFDSRVNDRGNRMPLPGGRFRYDLAMLAELARLAPVRYRMTLDDGVERQIAATLVAVGNGTSYGGGMRICAEARLDDGLFDVTVVAACSRGTLLKVFPKVYRGTHLSHPVVTVHRTARITLAAQGLSGYADGEPLGALPLTATCVSGAVRVLAGRGTAPGVGDGACRAKSN